MSHKERMDLGVILVRSYKSGHNRSFLVSNEDKLIMVLLPLKKT